MRQLYNYINYQVKNQKIRSTILTIVTKGMTKSSEIDVVINNGDHDDGEVWRSRRGDRRGR